MKVSYSLSSKLCAIASAIMLIFPNLSEFSALAAELSQQELISRSVSESQSELAVAVRDYESSVTRMENARRSVKEIVKQVDASNRQLAQAKNIYNKRVEIYYRTGPISLLEYIFSSKTPYEFSSRLDMMSNVAEQDIALIKEVEHLQTELQARLRILGQKYRYQQDQSRSLALKRVNIERQLRIEQDRLDRIKTLGSINNTMIASLPPERNMPSRDQEEPGSRDSGSIPMIFPINGAHAYQNTWGAPRSGGRHHQGTDIFANRGTPCVAVRDGAISTIDWQYLAGNYIRMVDVDGNMYAYIHLDSNADGLYPGKPVTQGEVIGYVGNTGNAAGGACHLHFEIHLGGGSPVNPYPYLQNSE